MVMVVFAILCRDRRYGGFWGCFLKRSVSGDKNGEGCVRRIDQLNEPDHLEALSGLPRDYQSLGVYLSELHCHKSEDLR
jgi:hypothetical protein